MNEKRFYSEHWHCYQHNILDRNLQDDDGEDWIIGTANGKDDAKNIVDLLNEQDTKIKQLKSRNKRQYKLLKKWKDLMFARDWEALENIVTTMEKVEEALEND